MAQDVFYVYTEDELEKAMAVYNIQLAVYEQKVREYEAAIAQLSDLFGNDKENKARSIDSLTKPEPPKKPVLWPFAKQGVTPDNPVENIFN